MRCAWCHNPEGISPGRELVTLEGRCAKCGGCRTACPQCEPGADGGAQGTHEEHCLLCGACATACPTGARQIIGEEMSVARVLQAVLRDRVFYEDSGGGVTFSGGEPLFQFDFLRDGLSACRAEGLRTAVDTCGLGRTGDLMEIASVTDLFLYDLKCMDEARHKLHTGVSNDLILENLRQLGRRHPQIWVRIPLIPGVNDDRAELEAMARFAASIPGVRQVNLLPFHRTGLHKLRRLGQPDRLPDLEPPAAETVDRALEIFLNLGLVAKAGG